MNDKKPSKEIRDVLRADSALKFSNLELMALYTLCEAGISPRVQGLLMKESDSVNVVLNILEVFTKLKAETERLEIMLAQMLRHPGTMYVAGELIRHGGIRPSGDTK